MEASEKLTFSDERGSVRVLGDRIVVERLEVADERTARVIRERAEADQAPARTVTRAIEIGTRVLDSEETAANVDYVRAELERGVGKLNDVLAGTLDAGNEALAEGIAAAFGADRSDSVQQQIKEMIGRANEEQRLAITRLFSSDEGANPLGEFKEAMVRVVKESRESQEKEEVESRRRIEALTREIVELKERTAADERVGEAEEAGTRKGRSFEEKVCRAIELIAAARGDAASAVGDEAGAGGSKKGDVLVEIGAAEGPSLGRVVFEVKDSRLAKSKAWSELNGAMEARTAGFAVLVVAGEDHIPPGQQELHEYEGNKLIVAVDPDEPEGRSLELAYRYARCRLLVSHEAELTVDAAGVKVATAEAKALLEEARAIKSALTTARNSVEKARTGVEAMVAAVLERLERIELLVASAGDESP